MACDNVFKISLQALWKIVKLVLMIQVFNFIVDYFVWVSYDYAISVWTIAALNVFYTVIVFAVKIAVEKRISFANFC